MPDGAAVRSPRGARHGLASCAELSSLLSRRARETRRLRPLASQWDSHLDAGIPATGGAATRITSGTPFDGQPRFSPDGKSIVFVSDRTGSENLYVIDPDGRNLRALTRGANQSFISPDWTPDGEYVVVSRSNDRSTGRFGWRRPC